MTAEKFCLGARSARSAQRSTAHRKRCPERKLECCGRGHRTCREDHVVIVGHTHTGTGGSGHASVCGFVHRHALGASASLALR